jgi:hypothetical protein
MMRRLVAVAVGVLGISLLININSDGVSFPKTPPATVNQAASPDPADRDGIGFGRADQSHPSETPSQGDKPAGSGDPVPGSTQLTPGPGVSRQGTLFSASFPAADRLVTNEYAYWNPGAPDAVRSSAWEMTSGSLFSRGGGGYTGPIDDVTPDARSAQHTNSAVFRLTTRDYGFGDVKVGFRLTIAELSATPTTPATDWDGVHIWLRYQNEQSLYYASVARRDGRIVIKKKCPGGPSNDGTYYELSPEAPGYRIVFDRAWDVSASVRNNSDGTVTITLFQNDQAVLTATDRGIGCAALTRAGAIGIRGDNARFRFASFEVSRV